MATAGRPRPLLRACLPLARWALALAVLGVACGYVIIPELRQAHLSELSRIGIPWLVAGGLLQAASQFCFSLLTRCLLPADGPGLPTVMRVDLSCAALAHVVPAGSAASAALGYRMFTSRGVRPKDMCFILATQGPGSSIVLNLLLWLALIISIPVTGFHRIYLAAAIAGLIGLTLASVLLWALLRREERTVRLIRAAGRPIPWVGADSAERAVRGFADSVRNFTGDRRQMRAALRWATANWLLQAAALWCFVAALGHYVNPVVLFAAFGMANVAAALPLTPSGLGVIEGTLPLLLGGNGVTAATAALAVLGWRVVSFWLPIPVGAAAYASLHLPWRAGARAASRPGQELAPGAAAPAAAGAAPRPAAGAAALPAAGSAG